MNPATGSPALLDHPRPVLLDRTLVRAFLENVPDAVFFKDQQSRFIAASASQVRHLGATSPLEILGRTDFDFFTAAHAQAAFEEEQRILRTGEPVIGKLGRVDWADGRVTWVLTSKMALCDEHGETLGTFGISKDVTDARRLELDLEKAKKDLVDASRIAGMAEVATSVLHNVGNVLNSLNVSATVIAAGLRQTKADSLAKVAALLRAQGADLGAFLTNDPKGKRMPEFIASLALHFAEERDRLLQELGALQKNIDHIKEIVAMQQAYATMAGTVEPLDPVTLMEDSLRMNAGALVRHDVRVVREFAFVPTVLAEKAKVLQILVNLIRNAKYACDDSGRADKVLTLRVETGGEGRVRLTVQDNGVGIAPNNLTRIFAHGFTTRAHGHGFGLHSSANAAREMNASLTAQSDGPGCGATFILELPAAPPAVPEP